MEFKQLLRLLSEGKQQKYASVPVWHLAAEEVLPWREAALSERHVEAAYRLLGDCGKSVLRAILSRFGYEPIAEEKLLRQGPPDVMLSGAEFRRGMNELLEAGILFAARRGWGERYYFIARDSFPLWHRQLFSFPADWSVKDFRFEQLEQAIAGEPAPFFGNQLLAAWAELSRSSGLTFTAKERLPKKAAIKAGAVLATVSKRLYQLGIVSADQDQSSGLAMALELALRLGVMERRHDRLEWNEAVLSQWFALPVELREARLYQWCKLQLLGGMPIAAHAAAVAEVIPPRQWAEERWLAACIEQISPEVSEGNAETCQTIRSWLLLLQACGWLELVDCSEDALLRWRMDLKRLDISTLVTRRKEPIIIEPNGEIIALPNADYRVLWELELIADRISADRMTIYRSSAASIARAVKHGRTAAGITAFLEQASGTPLPALVASLVADWTAQAERLKSKELPASARHPHLHIADDDLTGTWMSDPIPLSPSAGMLSGVDWELRLELLQEDRAMLQTVFPELETVPVNWLRQLRDYHFTTRREVIERALKWQSPVQLRMEAGVVSFVPDMLEADGDSWAVSGVLQERGDYRKVRLTPGMWDEMRLVTPGINGDL